MSELISVIVPIFNVALYLPRCINSICGQTYSNLEIILVDDGSTDGCYEICENFKKGDSRIVVIHKENGGITTARKAGAKRARGSIITFVDGDDWIEPTMYEVLYKIKKNKNVELIMSGCYRDSEGGTYAEWRAADWDEGLYEGEKLDWIKENLFQNGRCTISGGCWNKLFDRELLLYGLTKMDNNLYGIEDDMFVYFCFVKAKSIYIKDQAFYHGFERKGSATHSRHGDYYLMLHRAIQHYEELMSIVDSRYFRNECEKVLVTKVFAGIEQVFTNIMIPRYQGIKNKDAIKGKKIVLYGGGVVGESYYCHALADGEEIVGWIDNVEAYSKITNHPLQDVTSIDNLHYDIIVIANAKENVAIDIEQNLIKRGIIPDKIYWEKPRLLTELFFQNNN